MNLTFKTLMLAGAFATGFWTARDAHARDWALNQLKTAATALLYKAAAIAPAWKAPEPVPAQVEDPPEPDPSTVEEDPPQAPSRRAPKKTAPSPEERYIDALSIIESGPADHGVR